MIQFNLSNFMYQSSMYFKLLGNHPNPQNRGNEHHFVDTTLLFLLLGIVCINHLLYINLSLDEVKPIQTSRFERTESSINPVFTFLQWFYGSNKLAFVQKEYSEWTRTTSFHSPTLSNVSNILLMQKCSQVLSMIINIQFLILNRKNQNGLWIT